ncbi:MAG: respiratory nitrate reductase subunit gamma [Desulfobacterales bacterium]|nr:respiratory nitrate reductase subunit gamma [Desulfobacterales bacterium]
MHSVYSFVTGPMVWVAFGVFVAGCLFRLVVLLSQVSRKEPFIFSYMNLKWSLRSIGHWIVPFATVNWRRHPVLTVVTFVFHICLFLVPIFLLSHIVLVDEAWSISWAALPDGLADALTLTVIACCLFFLVRRIRSPEVKFVTYPSDYVILAIVAAPFVTGFLAYHQWFGYPVMFILHVIAGEIMLIAIPFTRLSHMLFAVFTRAYMGSEFGGVRKAKDW